MITTIVVQLIILALTLLYLKFIQTDLAANLKNYCTYLESEYKRLDERYWELRREHIQVIEYLDIVEKNQEPRKYIKRKNALAIDRQTKSVLAYAEN